MRQTVLLSALALLIGAGSAQPLWAQNPTTRPVPVPPPVFSPAEKTQLKRISTYLNGMKNVQGRFLQIGANGRSDQGTFYLKKPGRVRFEYNRPNPNLIVADGTTLAVENSDLKTTDRYPLGDTPLRLLLSQTVDLASDSHITAIKTEAGALSVTARENSGPAQGTITLTFADAGAGGLELRQWEVLDAQGAHTAVVLNDLHQVPDIPARLFVIQDLSPFKKSD